jgi:hypothetical protein
MPAKIDKRNIWDVNAMTVMRLAFSFASIEGRTFKLP